MWWSDLPRRLAPLALLALLAGCGLAPVYAPGSTASLLRDQTAITAPDTVAGYRLLQALRDRLGDAVMPAYDLTVTFTVTPVAAATTSGGSTSRYAVTGLAGFVLRDRAGDVLLQGEVGNFASYAASGTTVATAAAETDAGARLAILLADQIMSRLAAADLIQ